MNLRLPWASQLKSYLRTSHNTAMHYMWENAARSLTSVKVSDHVSEGGPYLSILISTNLYTTTALFLRLSSAQQKASRSPPPIFFKRTGGPWGWDGRSTQHRCTGGSKARGA